MPQPNVAIVTGGSRGIGATICTRMLDAGYSVISLSRGSAQRVHPRLISYQVDLLDAGATADVARDVARRYAVTHLVHNAGLVWRNPIENVTNDEITGMTQLHVGAAMLLLQGALPAMKSAGFGRVILMSSRAILGHVAGRSVYAASKAAILGLARSWARELGPHGITVNTIVPAAIETEQLHGAYPAGSAELKKLEASIPVGRLGRPEDVASVVMFFADRDTGYVTGQSLYVCGGTTLGAAAL